jgi:hypothetical protein
MNNKLEFRDYVRDLINFKIAVAQGRHLPVRDLVQQTNVEFWGANQEYQGISDRMAQADTFVRFLLSPEARGKQTKGLLASYLQNLLAVVAEVEQENIKEKGEASTAPKTEAEEEALYKQRSSEWKSSEREKQIVSRTFTRTFGAWTDKDWDAVEKAFMKYID